MDTSKAHDAAFDVECLYKLILHKFGNNWDEAKNALFEAYKVCLFHLKI